MQIKFSKEEKQYISSLISSHQTKIDFLSTKEQKVEPIKDAIRISGSIEKKLRFIES